VFQSRTPISSLNPRMSVRQISEEGCWSISEQRPAGSAKRGDIDAILKDVVGLSPIIKDSDPHEFPRGQRRVSSIARAHGAAAGLLVRDEADLGAGLRRQVRSSSC